MEAFLAGSPHAVVGASRNRDKYGNKVLRAYLQNERAVFAVHPSLDEIEGSTACLRRVIGLAKQAQFADIVRSGSKYQV